ncbi:MAG: nucleotidyltransferase family protein [Alphaproteobacteria bacterium]|nr:nucleotidyltransferase family protein [Alphaproteobacteria bacterium]MCZ6589728.1 nucleotidyltransferase family protein [Alphaproteobacteria bacterium]MCZ6837796.1 nucleotidyltransferase family protein [Alphaproteobacteria bacterium]MCZ6845061.1 nucleotidyltransferase family protein [Alphaproteobacteria bacterium]
MSTAPKITGIQNKDPSATAQVSLVEPPLSLLKQCLIGPDTSIHTLIERFNTRSEQIGIVVDEQRRLLGTVTDGDLRRGVLRGVTTDAPVREIMNTAPRTLSVDQPRDDIANYMRHERVRHLPIVDFAGRAIDLVTLDTLLGPTPQPYPVVIMAGGEGKRLRPLTEHTPKPMLDVGGQPILETIIRRCAAVGFSDFYISVNYRADVIKHHFGDGRPLGVEIRYLEEMTPLGTAGPLGQLPSGITTPVLVLNGDVLTKMNPARVVEFHRDAGAAATMGVREYEFQIPYGVVDIDNNEIRGLREKPVSRQFINAGIYVLDQNALDLLPRDAASDMPALFATCRTEGLKTLAFPIREYWVDIGHIDDYRRANEDYPVIF